MNEITPTPKVQTIENATLDDVRPGDHLDWEWTRVRNGVTITSQRVGIAYHRDSDGDWWAVEGGWLTQGEGKDITLTIRRPAVEEVELPTEPCVLTDVRLREALVAGAALWTGLEVVVAGFAGRAVVMRVRDLVAFTLPDGIRARRDGEHEDGTPRFVTEEGRG